MAKKLTWRDAKKKYDKGLEELDKLEKQEQVLKAKIQAQKEANQEAKADYIVRLSSESLKSDKEVEAFFLGNQATPTGGD
ncbi:hypothetical protein ACR3IL_11250 [Streptococcus iniae]|uniref:hypothetical protein n=1 Tax=Streptococcus agalactiae TaxID=1311 RepID=UPI0008D92BE7|nr:hypothetical protein [Streptococcus agalactiae]ELY5747373.1 hypothetical protein [Streptococcus iniae]KAF0052058.1 hypothetical protein GL192_00830 [Streptococcus agalactiae]OHX26183.1 hypothetical protein BKX95_11800 [Streptococcus iniae]